MTKNGILDRLRTLKFSDLIECPECEYKSYCIRCYADCYLQTGNIIVPPYECETYTDADLGYWYFIDDKKIKLKEESMDWETQKKAMGVVDDPPRGVPDEGADKSIEKLYVDINIQIKDGHILVEFGCKKHICHNLNELMAVAKKELLKEMPILKDFGKEKKEVVYDKKLRKRIVSKQAADPEKS